MRAPAEQPLAIWSELPAEFRRGVRTEWGDLNMGGKALDCFLEGPVFDDAGNLYVVDIPFGRIFRVDPAKNWSLVAEYDGWPNGMKWRAGKLIVADHKLGLVEVDPATGRHTVLLDRIDGAPLLGLNDLAIAPDGTLYTTDQGQTGLHDPSGRVLRLSADGPPDVILDNGPSPNGLVFDPARNWLYVAMTRGNAIWRVPFFEGRPVKVGLAIQLSGGIGPDGLTLDPRGNLLVVQAPFGVWQFDRHNRPVCFFAAPDESYVTNLVVRQENETSRIYVTDSLLGHLLVGDLGLPGAGP